MHAFQSSAFILVSILFISSCVKDAPVEAEITGMVEGTVTVDGEGMPGAIITYTGRESKSTTTDEQGNFQFNELSAGNGVVTLSGIPANVTCPQTSKSVLVRGDDTSQVDFICQSVNNSPPPEITSLTAEDIGDLTAEFNYEFRFEGASEQVEITIDPGDGSAAIEVEFQEQTESQFSGSWSYEYAEAGTYTTEATATNTQTSETDSRQTEVTIEEDSDVAAVKIGLFLLALTDPEAVSTLGFTGFLTEEGSRIRNRSLLSTKVNNWQTEVDFGEINSTFPIAVAGAEGYQIVDLLDNSVLLDETDIGTTAPLFGIAAATQEPPGTGSDAMLFAFGASNAVLHRNSNGGSFSNTNPIVFTDEPTYDALPAGGNAVGANVLSYVQPHRGVRFYAYTEAQGLYVPAGTANEFDDGLFEGELVSAYIHSDDINANGRLIGSTLVLTRGEQSWLYFAKRDGSNPTQIADLGKDARKVRCAENGEEELLCAVSVFGDDQLAILTWDGQNVPNLVDTYQVGDGPVGIDLQLLESGNIGVVSTGFNDNTVTVTELNPEGSYLNTDTRPVLEGCQNPGHAIFIQDAESVKLVGTCYGSGHYFVMESGL